MFSKIDKFSVRSTTLPHILAQPRLPPSLLPARPPHPPPPHLTSSPPDMLTADLDALDAVHFAADAKEPSAPYSEEHLPEFTPMGWCVPARTRNPFPRRADPPSRKLQEIRAAIPQHLFVRDTRRGLLWLAVDLLMAAACWRAALHIDPTFRSRVMVQMLSPAGAAVARWACWMV